MNEAALGPFSVSEINIIISTTIKEAFLPCIIKGEVSSFKPASSGHWYFSLKDKDASLSCNLFKSHQYNVPQIKNGDMVVATGYLDFWVKGGTLSFNIYRLELAGKGSLREEIEKRRQYYASLGYFDEKTKKDIPDDIRTLGVVTSPSGAAIQDILRITKRRAPSLDILIFPTAVQGEGAPENIASRIRQANNFAECDVLIVGRGGGSEEDLSAFSSPEVIEAIHNSQIPVISAVGHEIDYPLSDYVADLRAPTPSAAAEIVTEPIFRRREKLEFVMHRIKSSMKELVSVMELRLNEAKVRPQVLSSAFSHIATRFMMSDLQISSSMEKRILEEKSRLVSILSMAKSGLVMKEINISEKIKSLKEKTKAGTCKKYDSYISRVTSTVFKVRLGIAMTTGRTESYLELTKKAIDFNVYSRYIACASRFETLSKEIEALSPLNVLKRGYSVVTDSDGKIINDAQKIQKGEVVMTRFYIGKMKSKAEEIYEL